MAAFREILEVPPGLLAPLEDVGEQDEDGALFSFKQNPADSSSADLADGDILPVLNNTITDPNKLAEQFVMILPLKNPIQIK